MSSREQDPIEEELDAHLRMAIEERMARGESRGEAERNARRELGNLTVVSEVTREQRRGPMIWVDRLTQELRVSMRSLMKSRAFTLGVVGCWAIAIAAHAAMLAIVDQIFVRPPAHVSDPNRVVRLYARFDYPGQPAYTTPTFSFQAADALRRDASRVGDFAAYAAFEATAGLPGGIRTVRASAITRNYFGVLGVSPLLGAFPVEGLPTLTSCSDGMVISHALFTAAFGGQSSVLGSTVRVADRVLPVCAVAPAGFNGGDPTNPEVWIPVEVAGVWARGANWREDRNWWVNIVARVHWFAQSRSDDVAAAAKRVLEPIVAESSRRGPPPVFAVIAASIVPGRAPGALAQNRTILWLGGAATLLLLLATLNVSTMLLLRTLEKQPEFALRRVLGASSGTIARHVGTEVIAIGALGAVVGLTLAQLLRPVLQQLLGVDAIPIPLMRVVAIEGAALAVAAVIASLPPILAAVSAQRAFAHRADPRSTASARAGLARSSLLVLQVASCVVLVAGALVMARSLKAVRDLDLGIDASRVLVASLDDQYAASLGKLPASALVSDIAAKAAHLPGVTAIATANRIPFGMAMGMSVFNEEQKIITLPNRGVPMHTGATHGFFSAIGAKVLKGRTFTAAEDSANARVAVVNATFATIAYPNAEPVGRCIFLGSPKYGECYRIIGVVADQRRFSVLPEEPIMDLYVPMSTGLRFSHPATQIILRVDGDPASLAPAVERIARSVLPPAAPITVQPLARRLDPQVRPFIAGTRLLSIYSFVAFIVATAGILGTLAYLARLAKRATAIRMALGATEMRAAMSVARSGIVTTVLGLVIGGALAMALRGRAGPLLFGVDETRIVMLIGQAVALVGLAGVVASVVPAWRGSRPGVFRSLNAD